MQCVQLVISLQLYPQNPLSELTKFFVTPLLSYTWAVRLFPQCLLQHRCWGNSQKFKSCFILPTAIHLCYCSAVNYYYYYFVIIIFFTTVPFSGGFFLLGTRSVYKRGCQFGQMEAMVPSGSNVNQEKPILYLNSYKLSKVMKCNGTCCRHTNSSGLVFSHTGKMCRENKKWPFSCHGTNFLTFFFPSVSPNCSTRLTSAPCF